MARRCELTGKQVLFGHKVSHSNRKTRTMQRPNIVSKRFWLEDEQRWVRLRVSTRAIRTIDKIGLRAYAKKAGVKL